MDEMHKSLELLKRLCLIPAPSGMEQMLCKFISNELKGYADKIEIYPLGDLIAYKKGTGSKNYKVLIDSHADEIGCLVKFIDKRGFIRLMPTGYFDTKVTIGQAMTVFTREGQIEGVIGAKYPILETALGAADTVPPFADLFLDIGADSEEEVLSWGVQLGDYVTWSRSFSIIGQGKKCRATALDPRSGVYTLIEVMKSLSKSPVEADVYVSFNVQEETAIGRHAALCTNIVNPHVIIELCNSLSANIPGVREDLAISKQGDGTCIVIHEQTPEEPFTGSIVHPMLLELFIRVAQENNIKFQIQPSSVCVLSGVPYMRLLNGGIPSITLNLSLANGHSPYEIMSIYDIISRKQLIQFVLPYLNSDFIEKNLSLKRIY